MATIAKLVTEALSEAQWLQVIGKARARASHFLVYDLCLQAIAQWPAAMVFEHQAVLALARADALDGALQRYRRLEQEGRLASLGDGLAEEFAGLGGRLFKDLGNRSSGAAQQQNRLKSAQTYEAGYRRWGKYYLAINAASMYLAAGHGERATEYAAAAYELAEAEAPSDYWAAVTQAEAAMILHNPTLTAAKLWQAAAVGAGRLADLATTRQQLRWVAKLSGIDPEIIENLPKPRVLSWPAGYDGIAAIINEFSGSALAACGPVLSAADLSVAGQLLNAGAKEVNLVLPCEADHLLAEQPELAASLGNILRHEAVSAMTVTREGGAFEPGARELCQQQARGLARLRAQSLAVAAEHLEYHSQQAPPAIEADRIRVPRAIIFGDVRGFSKLDEPEQLRFLENVIGGFAEVLSRYPVEYTETAGDGLFVVLADVVSAARCCRELLEVMHPARIAGAGLPAYLGLRISAHVGPLYRRTDKLIGRDKFVGSEVIRTARIEPVTRVGEIFVTEQFAASLAGTFNEAFVCEYVGIQPMAKNYGECRMYSLRIR